MGFGNMQQLMKQAKKMQDDMAKKQEELKGYVTEVSGGGGAVSVSINGEIEILSITIDKEVIDPSDKETLEDLVLATVNSAIKKAQNHVSDEMGSITGGMNIPGM